MPDLKDTENLKAILLMLIPGIVFLWARVRLITGRMPPFSDTVIVYFAITVVYWGLAWPTVRWFLNDSPLANWQATIWILAIFVGPMVLGAISGGLTRGDVLSSILNWLGIEPVHPATTAWDRIFFKPARHFIRVTLEDGSFIAGEYAKRSYASSDATQRDLFLERSIRLDANGAEITGVPQPAIYIPAAKIKYIEFYPTSEASQ